jgi:hypothetical protein
MTNNLVFNEEIKSYDLNKSKINQIKQTQKKLPHQNNRQIQMLLHPPNVTKSLKTH